MRLGESGHAGELKVGFRQLARVHRCSEALVLVAAVNPAGGEAERVCGLMVMEQTFGDVKDVAFLDAHGAEPDTETLQQVFEVARVRLVGSGILRGDDSVELYLQATFAALKALVVHIREDDEFIELLEILQGAGRVCEGGPVFDGAAVGCTFLVRRRYAPLLGQPLEHDGQQVSIELCGRLPLLRQLVEGMRLEDFIAGQSASDFAGQRLQRLDHPALPIDERAVAVEGKHFEVGQAHGDLQWIEEAATALAQGSRASRAGRTKSRFSR